MKLDLKALGLRQVTVTDGWSEFARHECEMFNKMLFTALEKLGKTPVWVKIQDVTSLVVEVGNRYAFYDLHGFACFEHYAEDAAHDNVGWGQTLAFLLKEDVEIVEPESALPEVDTPEYVDFRWGMLAGFLKKYGIEARLVDSEKEWPDTNLGISGFGKLLVYKDYIISYGERGYDVGHARDGGKDSMLNDFSSPALDQVVRYMQKQEAERGND